MNFSNKKQVVRDIIEKVIIKERRTVEVWCHISLQQLVTASTVNVGYEPIGRELHHTTPTYEPIDFPFQFNFKLPDPRKMRIILERDGLGRIIHSKPPEFRI